MTVGSVDREAERHPPGWATARGGPAGTAMRLVQRLPLAPGAATKKRASIAWRLSTRGRWHPTGCDCRGGATAQCQVQGCRDEASSRRTPGSRSGEPPGFPRARE
jgi:hypothetical protein